MPSQASQPLYSVVSANEKTVGPFDTKWKASFYAVLAQYVSDIRILTHTDSVVWEDTELPPLLCEPSYEVCELVTRSAGGHQLLHISAETIYEVEMKIMKLIDTIKEFLGMLGHEDLMDRIFEEVTLDDWEHMLFARIQINNMICDIHEAQIRGHA